MNAMPAISEVELGLLNVGCSTCGDTAEVAICLTDGGHTLEIIATLCAKHRNLEIGGGRAEAAHQEGQPTATTLPPILPCTRFNCQDPNCDRVHLRTCEKCGQDAEHLYSVSDDDPAVGYFSTVEVCAECRG